MNLKYSFKSFHYYLLFLTVSISIFGIVIIGSAEKSLQKTQTLGLFLGLVVMFIVSVIDYNFITGFYRLIYLAAIILLLLVKIMGSIGGGAQRWIDLGFFRFQPSELCKILLIIFFAKFFELHIDEINNPKLIIRSVVLIGIPMLLILTQPDLSTTIVVALIFCTMIFMAGLSYRIVGTILAVSVPLVVAVVVYAANTVPGETFLPKYQHTRIVAWLNPEEYKTDEGMQQQNSIIAIGSGQLHGKGLNNDEVASLKNGNFVPEPQTDFIFAVVGEELGFVGCCTVIILLLLLTTECFAIGRRAPDYSGRLICYGMGALIGFQTFINVSVTTGIFPNTGLTLPFVSYGLTSLVSLYIGIGLVFNVGLKPQKYERQVKIV